MTPEEKLLALIQQDKRQAAPAAAPVAAPDPSPRPSPARGEGADGAGAERALPSIPESAPKSSPSPLAGEGRGEGSVPPGKKLKLADAVAPAVAPDLKPEIKDVKPGAPDLKSEIKDVKSVPAAPSAPAIPVSQPLRGSPAWGSLSPLLILNRALAVVVLGLIVVIFYAVMSIKPGIAKELERQIEGAGSLSVTLQTIVEETVPSLDFYLDKVSARNPFVAKGVAGPSGSVAAEKAGAPKDLKLMAVSVDGASPADSMAIIKNKTDSKTYFVKLGQTVGDTDFVLDKVLADRIVLKQRKQEYELK